MDFLTYIQKLQNELTAHNLPKDQIHTIITQESALAETKEPAELNVFFTLDRLENLLVQAKQQNEHPRQDDEFKTIVPQGSSKIPAIRILDEEKTILPSASKATLQSLTDEATMVVISGNPNDAAEEKTIAASPDLKKLLSENETVKISEKDTVFFDNTPALPKEDETVQQIPLTPKKFSSSDTTATLPAHKPIVTASETITEQTRPILSRIPKPNNENEKKPSVTESKEKEVPPVKTSKNEPASSALPLSSEAIRNPHPHISFFWIAFLLIPSICFLAVLIAAFILVVDLLFLLAFTAVMLFYLFFLLIPLFIALYSAVFAFLYWRDTRIAEGLTEFGLMLLSSGLALMFGYLLYRPFILISEWIGEKFKSFNKKTFLLVRNLYRYSVKGAEKL